MRPSHHDNSKGQFKTIDMLGSNSKGQFKTIDMLRSNNKGQFKTIDMLRSRQCVVRINCKSFM